MGSEVSCGANGMIIYHVAGDAPVSPKKVAVELLSHVLAAGILAYFLSVAAVSYWRRVGLSALLGAFGIFAVSSIYWNWYGFPHSFFLAQGVDMTVGWAVARGAIAKLIPPAQIRLLLCEEQHEDAYICQFRRPMRGSVPFL